MRGGLLLSLTCFSDYAHRGRENDLRGNGSGQRDHDHDHVRDHVRGHDREHDHAFSDYALSVYDHESNYYERVIRFLFIDWLFIYYAYGFQVPHQLFDGNAPQFNYKLNTNNPCKVRHDKVHHHFH